VVFVAFGADVLWRRSPKRVSVVELSTAERVSERGIGFDGRTRERTGNFCWDPSWRGEDGVRMRNATSGVEGAGDPYYEVQLVRSPSWFFWPFQPSSIDSRTPSMMVREERVERARELKGGLVVSVAFDADISWRQSPKRVSVLEFSTAERVSERGICFDGRTRERTGNIFWDPSW